MKPVDQTISDHVWGNCLEACIASILEIPLDAVPNIAGGNSPDWFQDAARVLAPLGYSVAYMPNDPPVKPPGYHIGVCDMHKVQGETIAHAVVAKDGVPVHCPHESRSGLRFPTWYWILLVPLADSAITNQLLTTPKLGVGE